MIILRELPENELSGSQVAEKNGIHVNGIYAWKKKLFENAALIFADSAGKSAEARKSSGKVEQLEEKLRKQDEAISFLLRERG
ncbi:MAG: transposase [Ignavibacteriaceae bacterium]|nr:MAG: transposase [Ignavibacteriaceae bacterium]